jgi:hypothetical protein
MRYNKVKSFGKPALLFDSPALLPQRFVNAEIYFIYGHYFFIGFVPGFCGGQSRACGRGCVGWHAAGFYFAGKYTDALEVSAGGRDVHQSSSSLPQQH